MGICNCLGYCIWIHECYKCAFCPALGIHKQKRYVRYTLSSLAKIANGIHPLCRIVNLTPGARFIIVDLKLKILPSPAVAPPAAVKSYNFLFARAYLSNQIIASPLLCITK